MQWRAGTGACWAGFAADGIASNGNSANIWTAGCVSLIRKWLNLEKEAETRSDPLSSALISSFGFTGFPNTAEE